MSSFQKYIFRFVIQLRVIGPKGLFGKCPSRRSPTQQNKGQLSKSATKSESVSVLFHKMHETLCIHIIQLAYHTALHNM